MKDDLIKLFERLEKEGVSVMPEVYALTSPHLYGIVKTLVSDEVSAQIVLKSVYARIWERREVLQARHRGDPLNYIRRLAHRLAMDFKLRDNVKVDLDTDFAVISNLYLFKAKARGISEQDMRILSLAYLKGASISDISAFEKLDVSEIRQSLKNTMNRLRGDVS